jgi:hypothetical protein
MDIHFYNKKEKEVEVEMKQAQKCWGSHMLS